MGLQLEALGRAFVIALIAALINILWSEWPKSARVWRRTALVAAAVFVITLIVELSVDAVEDVFERKALLRELSPPVQPPPAAAPA